MEVRERVFQELEVLLQQQSQPFYDDKGSEISNLALSYEENGRIHGAELAHALEKCIGVDGLAAPFLALCEVSHQECEELRLGKVVPYCETL